MSNPIVHLFDYHFGNYKNRIRFGEADHKNLDLVCDHPIGGSTYSYSPSIVTCKKCLKRMKSKQYKEFLASREKAAP